MREKYKCELCGGKMNHPYYCCLNCWMKYDLMNVNSEIIKESTYGEEAEKRTKEYITNLARKLKLEKI
jgi:hypothetical protein